MNDFQKQLRAEAEKLADEFFNNAMELFRQQLEGMLGGQTVPPTGTGIRRPSITPSRTPSGRKASMTPSQLDEVIELVRDLLKQRGALRSEVIRAELGMDRDVLQRALFTALQTGKLVKEGERRATTYSLPPSTITLEPDTEEPVSVPAPPKAPKGQLLTKVVRRKKH